MKSWTHKRDAQGNVVGMEVLSAFNEPFDFLQTVTHGQAVQQLHNLPMVNNTCGLVSR